MPVNSGRGEAGGSWEDEYAEVPIDRKAVPFDKPS